MHPRSVRPDPTGPGEESVWTYPRPPRLEPVPVPITVEFAGSLIVDAPGGWRVLETSHPPTYFVHPDHVHAAALDRAVGQSMCEWKGTARYWTVRAGDRVAERVAWSYPSPTPAFESIRDHLAFYAGPMDRCTVDGEPVAPQPGGFYGGWITAAIKGPFKGGPGTMGW